MMLHLRVAARYKKKRKVPKEDGSGTTTIYEYGPRQVSNRNREKAERIEKLRSSISGLRKRYRADLSSKDAKTRLTALAIALIDLTYERVGNAGSAKDNGHYGVTTWEKKHVTVSGNTATFKYVGKSGVKHEKTISDAKVVSALKAELKGKAKGDRLFCNENEGEECVVAAPDVNAYLKEFDVTAKDLRGLHANEEVKRALKRIRKEGPTLPKDRKEKDKILKEEFKKAIEEAAESVGHEASTLRSQYLVPGMEERFLSEGVVGESFVVKATVDRVVERFLWKL